MDHTFVEEFVAPRTVDEALQALGAPGARPIAGGTDLMVVMRARVLTPRVLVDLSRLDEPSLRTLEFTGNGAVRIGALSTMAQLTDSLAGRSGMGALSAAAGQLGSPLIRNRATLGGNLCNSSPAADTLPPLAALDATAVCRSPRGERTIPLDSFCIGVKSNSLAPDELLLYVDIPVWDGSVGSSFHKIGRRRAVALSVVSVAASVSVREGTVSRARLALGSVAPTVVMVPCDDLVGLKQDAARSRMDDVAVQAGDLATPITDVRGSQSYRKEMVPVLARRALAEALDRATNDTRGETAGEVVP
jgi:CO/xanthine dehydrogenase FAD-binding subunit